MSWKSGDPERRKEYPTQCYGSVQEQLKEISKGLSELTQSVEFQTEQYRKDYDRHQVSLEKHESTLYGNGHEGLTTRVNNNEGQLSTHRWIIGLGMTILVGIIVKVVAH